MTERRQSGSTVLPGDTPSSRKTLRPLQSLLRHRWVAMTVAAAVAAISIPVLIGLGRPVFYAESVFMVLPVTKSPVEDRETPLHRYSEFVNQQVLFVTREDVCLDALDRMGASRSAWQGPGESLRDAAMRLSASLQVSRIPETTYVAVGLYSGRSESLPQIVDAVIKAYLNRAKSQTEFGLDERTEVLNRRVTDLQDEIRSKSELMSGWAKELGVPSMEARVITPLIDQMERAPREAQARRVAAEARLAGVEARHKVLKEANTAERTVLIPDAELLQLRTVLLERKSTLKAKLFGLTQEHEGRKSIESEIAEIDAEIVLEEKKALDRQIKAASSKLEELRTNEQVAAQAEIADARRFEEVVTKELESQREKVQRLYPQAQELQLQVERLQHQLGIAQERLNVMRLETHAPGYVQLVMPAAVTEVPAGKRITKAVVLLAGLTALLIFAVPVGLDLIRDRVRSDAELEGAVISIPAWQGPREANHRVGDQLRRVALALDRERRLHNRSAFVFTSVLPGSGTSELVLDIARDLGEFGVTALAIEANAMSPDSRYRSNGHPGLAAGMATGIRASDLVSLSDEKFPDRIAVGPTEGRTTLAGLEKIDSFLGQVLGRYQAVLIDAPPILKSADAEFLASRVHAVVLVVEADRTPVAELERARRILRQVGANVVLTVMNRSRRRKKDQGQQSSVASAETP